MLLTRRMLRAAFALVTAGLLPLASWAATSAASAPADARNWLMRIQSAASQRNYQGTLVFSTGGAMSSSRIAHYQAGSQRFERVEMLDGQMRRVFRHNDVVQTVWPANRVVVIEARDPLTTFPSLLTGNGDHLFERYELKEEGSDRVAGHQALVFLLQPRDAQRFAQRLWADRDSGLLLRADVLSAEGRVLESSAFTEVTIGVRPQPDTVLQGMRHLDGYRILRPALSTTRLEAEGWSLPTPVPGFQQISCVKRPLEGASEEAPRGRQSEVLQSIFSDGLTHVSVFIEPYQPEHHKPVRASIGATHTLMQRQGDWWITVMGDVPMSTLNKFAASLERRP